MQPAASTADSSTGLRTVHVRASNNRHKAPSSLPANIDPPIYKPGKNPFHGGEKLVYSASWVGIPAATARIQLSPNRKNPNLWTAQAWVSTNKFVDLFFRMRDYVREEFHRTSFTPEHMYIRQAENRRFDEYRVTFNHTDRIVKAAKYDHKGVHTTEYRSTNPWGILSGVVMALSQPLEPGQMLSFDVFTGGKRFVFDFRVKGRERITTPMGTFEALKIKPSVAWMDDGSLKGKARNVTLWVTDDKRHLPLRIQAAAFIGWVRADLVSVSGQRTALRTGAAD